MQPLITYMHQITAGQVLSLLALLTIAGVALLAGGFALWRIIDSAQELVADFGRTRAKERDNG